MTCECGGELYQFTAPSSVGLNPESFPKVCPRCGEITLGGRPLPLPEVAEQQAASMAARAKEAAEGARDALIADPEQRIEKYFSNVYSEAYLQGFFRALAFYQHQGKEGRLVRLRELWESSTFDQESFQEMGLRMHPRVAEEFHRLLYLGDPRKKHGQGTKNERPSRETGSASV